MAFPRSVQQSPASGRMSAPAGIGASGPSLVPIEDKPGTQTVAGRLSWIGSYSGFAWNFEACVCVHITYVYVYIYTCVFIYLCIYLYVCVEYIDR